MGLQATARQCPDGRSYPAWRRLQHIALDRPGRSEPGTLSRENLIRTQCGITPPPVDDVIKVPPIAVPESSIETAPREVRHRGIARGFGSLVEFSRDLLHDP